jgi:uncharacterized protein YcaQ
MRATTIADIRRFSVSRLVEPTTLPAALGRLGFVQADPIRAPARAQDLTLRHRVTGYRAGDLERLYGALDVEEDFFINYGFVSRTVHQLMHPRDGAGLLPSKANKRARALLEFVRERGEAHPRDVDAHFAHGTVTNYWGGSSSATTHMLEHLHYKGLLRVVRRDTGVRIYALQHHGPAPAGAAARRARIDALVDVVVGKYAPLPASSLSMVVRRLRYAVPQWSHEISTALARAKARLARAVVDGETWYWPAGESATNRDISDDARLLAPFDPIVWDRRRFELLWNWPYRFEAYTPAPKRKWGYYALPMLWRDRVIGWTNVALRDGELDVDAGYVSGRRPRDPAFRRALDAELARLRGFLTEPPSSPPRAGRW